MACLISTYQNEIKFAERAVVLHRIKPLIGLSCQHALQEYKRFPARFFISFPLLLELSDQICFILNTVLDHQSQRINTLSPDPHMSSLHVPLPLSPLKFVLIKALQPAVSLFSPSCCVSKIGRSWKADNSARTLKPLR
ncbi:hypothetical protein ACTXT7_013652 [Hymenolepis weldensis]